jgi:hypothetical protein
MSMLDVSGTVPAPGRLATALPGGRPSVTGHAGRHTSTAIDRSAKEYLRQSAWIPVSSKRFRSTASSPAASRRWTSARVRRRFSNASYRAVFTVSVSVLVPRASAASATACKDAAPSARPCRQGPAETPAKRCCQCPALGCPRDDISIRLHALADGPDGTRSHRG